jgi:hypothetical protein
MNGDKADDEREDDRLLLDYALSLAAERDEYLAQRDAYLKQRDIAIGERNELRRQLDIALGECNELRRQLDIAFGERAELRRQLDIASASAPNCGASSTPSRHPSRRSGETPGNGDQVGAKSLRSHDPALPSHGRGRRFNPCSAHHSALSALPFRARQTGARRPTRHQRGGLFPPVRTSGWNAVGMWRPLRMPLSSISPCPGSTPSFGRMGR